MVTGSCYELITDNKRLVIDCGVFQGEEGREHHDSLPDGQEIDDVLITHAHADHMGRIPLLFRKGFKGQLWATPPTADLVRLMWDDAAHLEDSPISQEDVKKAVEHMEQVPYEEPVDLGGGVTAQFYDAAHIVGSASILIENGDKRILFSGDVGSGRSALLGKSQPPQDVTYLVMEATYGNQVHEKDTDLEEELAEALCSSLEQGGNVVIPAFAVERTQDLLLALDHIMEHKLAQPDHVFVDSPLGIKVTETLCRHTEALAVDQEGGECPLYPQHLKFSRSVKDSMAINEVDKRAVIIASGGMCEGGRIVHHLKRNIGRPESSIVFVGYQAQGTLGRAILDGAKHVYLIGDDIPVKAQIKDIEGLSAHADREGLLTYVEQANPSQGVYLVHGEKEGLEQMARHLREKGYQAHIPVIGDMQQL